MSVGFANNNNPFLQVLQQMGFDPRQMMQHLSGVQCHAGALRSMHDDFSGSANMSTGGLQNLLAQGAIPGSNLASPPNVSNCMCGGQYAQAQTLDFGAMPNAAPWSEAALSNRMNGMKIEAFVRNNPHARQALEARLGGRIVPDGINDGVLQIQRSPFGGQPGGGAHDNAMHSLGNISQGALGAGSNDPFGPGAFQNMMVGALANALGQGHSFAPQNGGRVPRRRLYNIVNPWEQRKPIPGTFPGVEGGGFAGAGGGGIAPMNFAGGGGGGGGIAPMNFAGGGGGGGGGIAPMNFAPAGGGGGAAPMNFAAGGGAPANFAAPQAPAFGGGFNGGGGVNGIGGGGFGGGGFGAAGLTIEDQVVLLLMQITKNFDKKIKEQADAVNKMQQQQGKGGKGGGDKSIDVETMKLKRLIDKRGQMFDMLRQVIDKYNETAKNMIQAVGR